MDNREKAAPVQPKSGRGYTIDELLAIMEPQYRACKSIIRQCIAGLTEHAARLAAQHQEEPLPRLRQLCIEMAEYWCLTEDDTLKGYQEMADRLGSTFDHAVSAARDSGHIPELSRRTKQNILDGLLIHAQDMRVTDTELERRAVECDILAESLEEQWQLETAAAQQPASQTGSMSL